MCETAFRSRDSEEESQNTVRLVVRLFQQERQALHGNESSQNQEKQRRNYISKENNNEILKSEFTPKKWAYLIQFVATTARLNEKGLIHNV